MSSHKFLWDMFEDAFAHWRPPLLKMTPLHFRICTFLSNVGNDVDISKMRVGPPPQPCDAPSKKSSLILSSTGDFMLIVNRSNLILRVTQVVDKESYFLIPTIYKVRKCKTTYTTQARPISYFFLIFFTVHDPSYAYDLATLTYRALNE